MSRLISAGVLAFDQIDIFLSGQAFVRMQGLTASAITVSAFVNNIALPWPLLDGSSTSDASISSGKFYFNEILGSSGYYSLRFFPDRTGFWKINIMVHSVPLEIPREFEVAPSGLFEPSSKGTLIASTTK
jgi:hypothetical protein